MRKLKDRPGRLSRAILALMGLDDLARKMRAKVVPCRVTILEIVYRDDTTETGETRRVATGAKVRMSIPSGDYHETVLGIGDTIESGIGTVVVEDARVRL